MKIYKKIDGWFHADNFFKRYFDRYKDAKYIEIGVFKGKSLFFAAEYAKLTKNNAKIHGVDNCSVTHGCHLEKVSQLLALNGFNNTTSPEVHLLKMESLEAAERFENGYFDIIYIDGSHTYEAVKADLNAWWPKLKVGGVLIGDDYWEPTGVWDGVKRTGAKELDGKPYGVKKAVDEFVESNEFELELGVGADWISYAIEKHSELITNTEETKKTRKRKKNEETAASDDTVSEVEVYTQTQENKEEDGVTEVTDNNGDA
jgi:predicted O-methyltransferase YrrM